MLRPPRQVFCYLFFSLLIATQRRQGEVDGLPRARALPGIDFVGISFSKCVSAVRAHRARQNYRIPVLG